MRQKRAIPRTRKVLKLRLLRRAREWSQEALGQRVGLSKPSIAMIERGTRKPSLTKAIAIAAQFDEPVEEVFSYVEMPA